MWLKIFSQPHHYFHLCRATSSTSTLSWPAAAADHTAFPTDASGTAYFYHRAGGTDNDCDGDVFLFIAAGETSADFVPHKTPGPTSHTLRLTLELLAYRAIKLTFEQAVRCQAAVPVDVIVWDWGSLATAMDESNKLKYYNQTRGG